MMNTPDSVADEARFPSGPWTGFYLDPRHPGRHGMDVDLTFLRGKISGAGDDKVGAFVIYGRFSDDGECRWNKEYGRHTVAYRGFREGKGIWGTWELSEAGRPIKGGFQIWPRGHGSGVGEHIEEHAPVPEVLVCGSV